MRDIYLTAKFSNMDIIILFFLINPSPSPALPLALTRRRRSK